MQHPGGVSVQARKNELTVQVRGMDTEANRLRHEREWPDQERKDALRKLTSLRAVALHRLQVESPSLCLMIAALFSNGLNLRCDQTYYWICRMKPVLSEELEARIRVQE
jgi:hypothetical protein